jgi:hypothetical protein
MTDFGWQDAGFLLAPDTGWGRISANAFGASWDLLVNANTDAGGNCCATRVTGNEGGSGGAAGSGNALLSWAGNSKVEVCTGPPTGTLASGANCGFLFHCRSSTSPGGHYPCNDTRAMCDSGCASGSGRLASVESLGDSPVYTSYNTYVCN